MTDFFQRLSYYQDELKCYNWKDQKLKLGRQLVYKLVDVIGEFPTKEDPSDSYIFYVWDAYDGLQDLGYLPEPNESLIRFVSGSYVIDTVNDLLASSWMDDPHQYEKIEEVIDYPDLAGNESIYGRCIPKFAYDDFVAKENIKKYGPVLADIEGVDHYLISQIGYYLDDDSWLMEKFSWDPSWTARNFKKNLTQIKEMMALRIKLPECLFNSNLDQFRYQLCLWKDYYCLTPLDNNKLAIIEKDLTVKEVIAIVEKINIVDLFDESSPHIFSNLSEKKKILKLLNTVKYGPYRTYCICLPMNIVPQNS